MKGSVGPTTYSFLIVVASSLLSTIGVFWVVLWIDIVSSGEKCSDLFSQLFQGQGLFSDFPRVYFRLE